MPAVDILIRSDIDLSVRARQVCGMFDAPPETKQTLRWTADIPLEARKWNVGLIVGPSGAGKSTVAKHLFANELQRFESMQWVGGSMIDDMPADRSISEIAEMCSAVGFNTIPAWLRPFAVLSNGEKFRATIARALLDRHDPIVVDEFTSVVDRQTAQIGCHAIQRTVRKHDRQFVGVACHYDIIDWLQPDWVFEPATRQFQWRSVQRRPAIEIVIGRVPYAAWSMFAPFHYMSAELNKAARCFGLWANGTLAAFCAVLHRPHPHNQKIKGVSRVVTLPDWQGLGLAFVLMETLGAAFTAQGWEFRNYPAHPAFIRAHKPPNWKLTQAPGRMIAFGGRGIQQKTTQFSRPCAVFKYVGPKMALDEVKELLL